MVSTYPFSLKRRLVTTVWLAVWSLLISGSFASVARCEPLPRGYLIVHADPAKDGYRYQDQNENLQLVLQLLRNGYRVYWLAESNSCSPTKEIPNYRRGDFLVPLSQPDGGFLRYMLDIDSPRIRPIFGDLAASVYPLNYPRILVDAHSWASNYYWYYDTLHQPGFAFEHLYQHDANSFDSHRYNLFIAPGGGGDIPTDYNALLQEYVANGGNFIGSCWGAIQALKPSKASYGSGNGAGIAQGLNVETVRSFGALGGYGPVLLKNEAPDHPVMWDLPEAIHNIYWNGPVMQPLGSARSLASFADIVEPEFLFHSTDKANCQLDYREEVGKSIYLVSQLEGQGKVVLFGSHPEATASVSPFDSFTMGQQATYNSILFATAGPQRSYWLPNLRSFATDDQRLPSQETSCPPHELTELIHNQVQRTHRRVSQLIADRHPEYDEDDRTGFYLLRLADALGIVSRDLAKLEVVAANERRGKDLQNQLLEWTATAADVYSKLESDVAEIDPKAMNRWSFEWCPIVGPAFENAAMLSRLGQDLALHNAFCRAASQ